MSVFIDLTGERFERLKVVRRVKDGSKQTKWLCKCDCGGETITTSNRLKAGKTKSCGCYRYEIISRTRKKNKYIIEGNVVIGITHNGTKFSFDLEDYPKIKEMYWRVSSHGYIESPHNKGNIALHRMIMGYPSGMVIDHINGDVTDNRKSNLRICTQQQNSMNCAKSKNNTSNYVGVTWDKSKRKWTAQICYNRKHYFLGRYANIEDAVEARKKAEVEFFGEFARKQEVVI